MRIFISAGEPSGDIHGASLIRELKARRPDLDIVGFGGERMTNEGAKLIYPLVNLAVMFLGSVLGHITTFISLISRADRYFRHHKPDAVILIDYPGFHWWLARRAKFHGIPVFYFVPPQLWAWAGWRIKKMRRFVDHVLCTLPFEKPWYETRGVDAQYVGHPFFDELPRQVLDASFMAAQQSRGGEIIALLPGSRDQEVTRNLSTLVRSAVQLHRERPGVRFLVACFKEKQQKKVNEYLSRYENLPIETHVGRTPEILELCKACVAVSGSVSLEIMYRKKPAIVIFRLPSFDLRVGRAVMTTKFICLVNLLAGKEIYPEFLTDRNEATKVVDVLQRWLSDETAYREVLGELTDVCQKVASPGACARAAEAVLNSLALTTKLRRAS